jgi:toxin-antitoxin system PIN domain toxin
MPDVNILVYARREESAQHSHYAAWLTALVESDEPFGLSEQVLQGFIRVVTNKQLFRPATTLEGAFEFIDNLLAVPSAILIRPGDKHFDIFRSLCNRTGVTGKLTADAAHAALAIEHGCTWCSADTDFKRFEPLLRWERV